MRKGFQNTIRELFYATYGPRPPLPFVTRLENELFAIQSDRFIEDLVFLKRVREEADREGCEVDCCESYGVSLIRWLFETTRINPLPPHYFCPKCGKIEVIPEAKDGYNLPERTCCGDAMLRDGHALPFEASLMQLRREPGDLGLRLPAAFAPTAFQIAREVYEDSGEYHLVPVPLHATESGMSAAFIPASEERDPVEGLKPGEISYRTLSLSYSETKEALREAHVKSKRKPTVGELLSEKVLSAETDQIQRRLREAGRPLLQCEGVSFSQLAVLHGYERSAYTETNPVLLDPKARYSDLFTNREDALERLLAPCGVGLAAGITDQTRRGAFARGNVDAETERVLQEAGVASHWIEQMKDTCYLPPKADVLHTLMDEMALIWYLQNGLTER